jgi:hypothetical protein
MKEYIGMEVNGFKWYSHYKGIHSFMKTGIDGHHYEVIQCSEKQLHNGDISFMTDLGYTLSDERMRQIQKQYSK